MLRFNLKPMFDARGIDKPVAFLRKIGVSPYTASYITTDILKSINLVTLERICIALNCAPNDLIEWQPDNQLTDPGKYELNKLRREKKMMVVSEELRTLPLDKLAKVHKFIEETKQEES